MELSPEERIEKLRDPAVKAAILAEPTPSMGHEIADRMVSDFDLMYELDENPDYEPGADQSIAAKAKAAGISTVAFDRSGFRYHGRVQALADAAREAGLKF